MVNFTYRQYRLRSQQGLQDLRETGDDVRAILVMENTTAEADKGATFVGDITTLDEFDGAGYPTTFGTRVALGNQALNEDAANDRIELDADDVAFGALGAGTRELAGLILYVQGSSDADSPVLCFIDTVSSGPTFPFAANGGTVTVQWDPEGIIQFL